MRCLSSSERKPCGCCLAHGLVGWWQVPYLPTISWYKSNTMEIRGYQETNGWRLWETINRSWVTRDRLPALYFSVILRTQDFGVLWIIILCGLLVIFNVHLTLMVQSCCPWIRKQGTWPTIHHDTGFGCFFLSVGMPFCWSIYSLASSFHGDQDTFM